MEFTKKILLFTFFALIPTYHIHPMLTPAQKEVRKTAHAVPNATATQKTRIKVSPKRRVPTGKPTKPGYTVARTDQAPTKPEYTAVATFLGKREHRDIQWPIADAIFTIPRTIPSFKGAVDSARALSRVNWEFNTLSSKYGLQTIKSLSRNFEMSNSDSCKELGTEFARERLSSQDDFLLFIPKATALKETTAINTFKEFQERDVDFNFTHTQTTTKRKVTPLERAISMNDPWLVGTLIEFGADPKTPNNGLTALQYADFINASPEVSEVLKEAQ
jgi:hypothetical protein